MLVLLRDGPKHGYQLRADFVERTNGLWTLNTGQVYTTLDRLARDGLVVAAPDADDGGDDRRRAYQLTEAGRRRAEGWLAESDRDAPDRDELVLRVLLVIGHAPDEAQAVIASQRDGLMRRLQAVRRSQRDTADDLVSRLTADAAAIRLESELRWLDLCDERLRAATTRPLQADRPEPPTRKRTR